MSLLKSHQNQMKRCIEKDFLSKGVHVDSHIVDIDGDDLEEASKRKKTTGSSRKCWHNKAKNARLDKFESTLEKWTELVSAQIKASKARAKKYKSHASQATSPLLDPYSIEACMGYNTPWKIFQGQCIIKL